LTEGKTVKELLRRQPVQLIHDLILDKPQDGQSAPIGEGSDLEKEEPDIL
jgi:hypothetical protein